MYDPAPQGGPLIPVAAVVVNDDPFNQMHGQPVFMGEEVKEPAPKEDPNAQGYGKGKSKPG